MGQKYSKLSIDDVPRLFSIKAFEVFLRLGETKFVKIINKDEAKIDEILADYHNRGVSFLYCLDAEYEELLALLEQSIDENLEKAGASEDLGTRYDGLARSLNGIRSIISNLGMTKSVQEKTEKLVDSIMAETEKDTRLEVLFALLEEKNGLICKQALLTGYIIISIVEEMDWATQPLKIKLITAALFQNIGLENDEQARITSIQSEEFKNLDEYSQEIVLRHPEAGADLVKSPSFAGEIVQNLIKSHHETPLPGAFPGRLSAHNMPILEACFILASHFSTVVLCGGEVKDYSFLAQTLNEDFSSGSFKRAIQALLKTIASK